MASLPWLRHRKRDIPGDLWVREGMLKGFVDGTLGSRTAWMAAPYEGQPDNLGVAIHPVDRLATLAIAHQIDTPEEPGASHIADDRVLAREFRESPLEVSTDPYGSTGGAAGVVEFATPGITSPGRWQPPRRSLPGWWSPCCLASRSSRSCRSAPTVCCCRRRSYALSLPRAVAHGSG